MEVQELKRKLAQIEYCRQNCNQTKSSCKKSTASCRAIFKDELNDPDSWPNVMAEQNLSLLDSPDSPYILKSEVVKRIGEIKNRYEYDKAISIVQEVKYRVFNEAIQKAVDLFEEVRK
jgi:hypothetical protein